MKKILLVLLTSMISISSFSDEGDCETCSNSIKGIIDNMQYPQSVENKKSSEKVFIQYTVKDSLVHIEQAISTNPVYADYVKKEMEDKKINSVDTTGNLLINFLYYN